MRLHRLEVQALQAFPGREEVDFDALGAAGLFLLHGDTGAGKTTLLDAVCFALYGRLPGARGKDARERSDHAAPELRTEVVLEVTLRGERLRITRSPKQERPKRRGTGSTAEAATVHLERREPGGGWRSLASRQDEVAEELEPLLGMSREQFCQVVLLPQGEFATFLRAGSDERWVVLERLFATERFGAAEELLTRRRKEAQEQLQAARGVVRDVVSRVAQETAQEPQEGWEHEPARLSPWLQERSVGAEAQLITAESVCAGATAARDAADAALRAGDQLAKGAQRHAAAVAAVAAFERERPQRDALAAELWAARAAAAIRPLIEDGDRHEERARAAEAAVRGALAELERTRREEVAPGAAQLALPTTEPGELRTEAAGLRAQAGEAGALAGVEAAVAARRAQLAGEEGAAQVAAAEATAAQAQLTDGPTRRQRLAAAYDTARAASSALADRVAAAQEAHRRRDAAEARDRLEDELLAADAARTAAVRAAQDARARWLDVRQARLDGMAAELARGLTDGEPCLVCGATAHPAPAAGEGPPVDADTEHAAQAAHEQAEAHVRGGEEALGEVRSALAATTALIGLTPRAEAVAAADAADHARDVARRAAMELDGCAAAVMAFDDEQRGLGARRQAAAERAAAARARAAAWRAELEGDERRLRDALGPAADVATRVAALRAAARVREEAAGVLTGAADARSGAGQARARLLDAVREAGLADLGAARAALRSAGDCEALEARLRAWDDGLAARRAVVVDPELQAAAAAAPTDPARLRAAARDATAAQARAEGDHALARKHAHALASLARQLDAALAALAPVEARARQVRELALLVDGSAAANRKRMRLSAYVLAARLEEIAAAATVRLDAMSGGRYALEHSDEGARGQRRGGLDLRVVDGWTGRTRTPATLSGGETFLASLALALGLADVVEAEAGGARLETLFVDEGFGSLDPASLDMVLDVLDRLRDGGRAVGIVSHVGELRQRVPAQLHVVKGREGSRLEQVRGG